MERYLKVKIHGLIHVIYHNTCAFIAFIYFNTFKWTISMYEMVIIHWGYMRIWQVLKRVVVNIYNNI